MMLSDALRSFTRFNIFDRIFNLTYRINCAIQIMDKQEHQYSMFPTQQDIQNNQHALDILSCEGPSLDIFSQTYQTELIISSLSCAQFIAKIEGISNKQVRFAGSGKSALLAILACKQTKYYPHLLTLIKEQFFKPGVFSEYEVSKRNRVLGLCRNLEIQIISQGSIYSFLENNDDFLQGFEHILNKIVGYEEDNPSAMVQIIRKKFNIDSGKVDMGDIKAQCWILGMQKKIYLFEELSYFIVVSSDTSTDPTRNLNQSTIQNRLESQRSVEDLTQQVIIQASEQSTPKFKENQQSIRYRKKSHKNSFGGDFQITGYKQLVNLVNKSHIDASSSNQKSKNKKVFSLKFEIQEMGNLEIDEPINLKNQQGEGPRYSNQQGINIAKKQIQMRGSHIQGQQGRFASHRKQRKQKGQRTKHITSSQIFQLTNGLLSNNQKKDVKFEEQSSNSNSSPSDREKKSKKIAQQTNQKVKEGNEYQNFNTNNNNTNTKQNFKFSFSKKDSQKFIFKEIQNEYRKKSESFESENQQNIQPSQSKEKQVESSTQKGKKNLEYERDFKKKDHKRSLFLEGTIVPIQQQVQSSQQEKTESLPQSNQQREKQMLNFEEQGRKSQQRSQQNQPNTNTGFNWNSGQLEEVVQVNGNKGYLNIFKAKNRKFSYLTQPISISKNSLFGGHHQLRQSYVEQGNQTTTEMQNERNHHPPNYIPRQQNKNRVSRPAKIHKNSEAITESKSKRRFEENPISFSQMIANVTPHQDSNFSGHSVKNNKRQMKTNLCPNVVQFVKNNVMCYNQPEGWIRKEVIYYFEQENTFKDKRNSFGKPVRMPERFVINRSTGHEAETLIKNSSQHRIVNNFQRPAYPTEGPGDRMMDQNPAQRFGTSAREGDLSNSSSWHNIRSQNSPVERYLQSPTNIRSTIDTKYTQNRTENNYDSPQTPYFRKPTINTSPTNLNFAYFPNPQERFVKQNLHSPQASEKQLPLTGKVYSNLSPAPTTRTTYTNNINSLKQGSKIQYNHPPNNFRPNQALNLRQPQTPPHSFSTYNAVSFARSASPTNSYSNEPDKHGNHFPMNLQRKDEGQQKIKMNYPAAFSTQNRSNDLHEIGKKGIINLHQNQTVSYSPVEHRTGNNFYSNKSINTQPPNWSESYIKTNQSPFKPPTFVMPSQTPISHLYFQKEGVVNISSPIQTVKSYAKEPGVLNFGNEKMHGVFRIN